MTHFGIISPPVSGHINPWAALGRELQQRGHRVTLFQIPDVEAKALREGLEFRAIGQAEHPLGTLPKSLTRLSRLDGLAALRFALQAIQKTTTAICRDAPQAIQEAGVEALLVDQTEPAGATVADYLALPYVTVCCAMMINREAAVPPIFTAWIYQDTWWARVRNQLGYALFDRLTSPVRAIVARYRQQWHLPTYTNPEASFSRLAQISQQVPEFEFPRRHLPPSFHFVGPLRNASPQDIPFPYEQLTGQPLIYASLGTQQNYRVELFRQIATACDGLDAQLVMSHGGGMSDEVARTMPGTPLIVSYAPQSELLAKANLTITHAGLNTVLDSLSHGVPLLTIPITYEQPAIAARLQWVGAGEVLPLARLTVSRLRALVEKVLSETAYSQQAEKLQTAIREAGGVKRSADLIEQAISTGCPVLAQES